MTAAFVPFRRIGHAGALHRNSKRNTPDAGCKNGTFYKSPYNGEKVDSSLPLHVAWDTTCLPSSAIDIYLYAPGSNRSQLHMWQTVNYQNGWYNATLDPKWWNLTATMMLQLSIVAAGTQPFLSPFPAGPVITATYTGNGQSPSSQSSDGSSITTVNNMGAAKKPVTPGGKAAAVLMTLLVVALVIAGYIRWSRRKAKEQRKQFSAAVDKRMSTISVDWKSMSAAGAAAAIRNSMAGIGQRSSAAFSFGAIRPMSTATVDGGQAGVGARGVYENDGNAPVMSQLRPGLRTSAFGDRVSRVSFAADPRPSESRRNVQSRAFHSAFTPPVPEYHHKTSSESGSPGTMSPTQTQGPLTLTPDDIRARIAGQHPANPGVDEVMPALSLMRTGGDGSSGNGDENDYLFDTPPTPATPQPPTPILLKSPVGSMPMQPMPANVMSPDEMLRAYAERRAAGPGVGSNVVSYPAPVVNYNGNGIRTLYSPSSPPAASTQSQAQMPRDRMSQAQTLGSRYSGMDEDIYSAYIGTAE